MDTYKNVIISRSVGDTLNIVATILINIIPEKNLYFRITSHYPSRVENKSAVIIFKIKI